MPPEFIPSEKMYNTIIEEIKKVAGKDTEKIMRDLYRENPSEEKFFRTLALVMRRYLPISRINRALTNIRDKIANMVEVKVDPNELTIQKDGKGYVKIRIINHTGTPVRFKVSLSEPQKRTAIIYNPKEGVSYTKLAKAMVIEDEKAHSFQFIIKPGVYMIDDLYNLKKKNEIKIPITVKIDSNYDIIKLPQSKLKITIKRVMV